jgi:hypothetical protein
MLTTQHLAMLAKDTAEEQQKPRLPHPPTCMYVRKATTSTCPKSEPTQPNTALLPLEKESTAHVPTAQRMPVMALCGKCSINTLSALASANEFLQRCMG